VLALELVLVQLLRLLAFLQLELLLSAHHRKLRDQLRQSQAASI
jgi:hypothetical protein